MKIIFWLLIKIIVVFSLGFFLRCAENTTSPETEEDPYRYKYPNYIDGDVEFRHSPYHASGDSAYWHGEFSSKKFTVGDSLFLFSHERNGLKQEIPMITFKETVLLECSNGDLEIVIFNLPYPPNWGHGAVVGHTTIFGGIISQNSKIEKHNGFIEVQSDSVNVIAKYKSYWTGSIVKDTAYIFQ